MIATIIRDSPVLAGAIVVLIAIFLFLIIAITTAHRAPRPEAARQTHGRREPDFGGDAFDFDDLDVDYGRSRERHDDGPERRRRRYGFAGLAVSFLIGLTIGAGGLAMAPQLPVAPLLNALLGLVEAGSPAAREQASAQPAPEASPPKAAPKAPPTAVEKPLAKRQRIREVKAPAETSNERDRRLSAFVTKLQSELPKQVGAATTLTNVEVVANTVTLGYNIARLLSDAEATELQAALKGGVTTTFCSGKADEVRFLNDNGIVFRLIYFDEAGKTVAKLTAQPRFCEGSG